MHMKIGINIIGNRLKGGQKMKRIITLVLAIALVGSLFVYTPEKVNAEEFTLTIKGQLKSISMKWPKKKKAIKYRVYREKYNASIKREKKKYYKRIKTTKKRKFVDKKVKKNKYYSYFVDAINKKGKVIASTFIDYPEYYRKGLEKPEIYYEPSESSYRNRHDCIFLDIYEGNKGFLPKNIKYQFYRKAKDEKKYKKIKFLMP